MDKNETYRYPVALTIAGSDSGGGAGIQADIKTFSSLGVFGASAITAITAQNTQGVRGIQAISPEILRGQIEAILEDFIVDAVKIGMLHNKDAVKVVSETLPSFQQTSIILDPVMISTSGSKLLEDDAIRTIMDELFPKATLLTPNIPETEYLSGIKINNEADILLAARKLQEKGHRNGFYRFQECHAFTRERPVLLDQPRPDYHIGMVALRQCRHHTDACREGGRRPKQIG